MTITTTTTATATTLTTTTIPHAITFSIKVYPTFVELHIAEQDPAFTKWLNTTKYTYLNMNVCSQSVQEICEDKVFLRGTNVSSESQMHRYSTADPSAHGKLITEAITAAANAYLKSITKDNSQTQNDEQRHWTEDDFNNTISYMNNHDMNIVFALEEFGLKFGDRVLDSSNKKVYRIMGYTDTDDAFVTNDETRNLRKARKNWKDKTYAPLVPKIIKVDKTVYVISEDHTVVSQMN